MRKVRKNTGWIEWDRITEDLKIHNRLLIAKQGGKKAVFQGPDLGVDGERRRGENRGSRDGAGRVLLGDLGKER